MDWDRVHAMRITVLGVVTTIVLAGCAASPPPTDPSRSPAAPFTVVETGIPEIRAALESGRITSRQLVAQYLARIATYEDRINGIITVNPHALEEADRLDQERK